MIPILCHTCGAHRSIPPSKLASLSVCADCGSDDLDVDAEAMSREAAATKVPVHFTPVGDVWRYLTDLLGSYSVDHLDEQPDGSWKGVLSVPPEQAAEIRDRLNSSGLATAATLQATAYGEKTKTKVFRPGTSRSEIDAWIAKLPKKVQPWVQEATGTDGTVVLSVQWPSEDFDPRKWVRHPDWDAMVPDSMWNVTETVPARDLRVGDMIAFDSGATFDRAREVTRIGEHGFWTDGSTQMVGFGQSSAYAPSGFGGNSRDRLVYRFINQQGERGTRMDLAASLQTTAARWGIFSVEDDTLIYGPSTEANVQMAMDSGRYSTEEYYAGTMPDQREIQRSNTPGGLLGDPDPYGSGFHERTPTYEASGPKAAQCPNCRSRSTKIEHIGVRWDFACHACGYRNDVTELHAAARVAKAQEIRDSILASNPGMELVKAAKLAVATVDRYPEMVQP